MKPWSVLSAAGAALVVLIGGCQVIGGVREWNADPLPAAGKCSLPSDGKGLIRLVNAANVTSPSGSTAADFCIRPTGTSDWGRPVFRDGGQDSFCSTGLPYLQATVPFHVQVGSIDVKAIPAGQPCTAAATSEKDGIVIADAGTNPAAPLQVTTVLRYAGGKTSPEAISALHEEPGQPSNGSDYLRVVNALSGGLSINFGPPTNDATSLPTTIDHALFAAPIPPGAAPPAQVPSIGTVDAEGYLKLLNSGINYVAALDGDPAGKAIALFTAPSQGGIAASLFVVGDPASKNSFPVRGLFCEDRFEQRADAGPPEFSTADVDQLEQCTLTNLPTLSFDTWDTNLAGANSPFETVRRLPVAQAIAKRTSTDVICVTEADGIEDRDAIKAAATQFPYIFEIDTTTATVPDDPSDQTGHLPESPKTAPCGGAGVPGATVDKAYSCIAQNCGADGGTGPMDQYTGCLSSACYSSLAELYASTQTSPSDTADDVCFDCIVLNVLDPAETIPAAKTACTKTVAPAFMYEGQMPLMILSKYPFNSTKSYIYPSTGLQRGILKAQVQFEADLAVDVFCSQLASPQLDSSLPYIGAYGHDVVSLDGGAGENGWADEQELQATRGTAWIQSEAKRDGVPSVLMGTFYSTIGSPTPSDGDAGSLATGTLSPAVMHTLDQAQGGAFQRAEPPGYVRTCDTCPTNAYTPGHAPLEFQPMFLIGFPAGQEWTSSEQLWATEDTAIQLTSTQYEQAPPAGAGPLSGYYAHNWQLFRPPPGAGPADAGAPIEAGADASK